MNPDRWDGAEPRHVGVGFEPRQLGCKLRTRAEPRAEQQVHREPQLTRGTEIYVDTYIDRYRSRYIELDTK